MAAPYRIKRPGVGVVAVAGGGGPNGLKFYLDRLTKMIPGEVVGLYLVGSGVIPKEKVGVLVLWSVICLLGVIAVKAYGTADPAEHKRPDWIHVTISSIAFVIWLYTLGGPFTAIENLHQPYIGSLLVIAFTFFVPYLYKGPVD